MDIVEIVLEEKVGEEIKYRIKVNDKKIGYIKVTPNTIVDIWVDETFRKKGYGTMLIRHVEWIAKKSGEPTMFAHAIANTEEAKILFEANSYVLFPDKIEEYEGYKNILKIH